VDHEVDIPFVDVGHLILGIGKPQMSVADEGHTQGVLVSELLLDDGHLFRIDTRLALDVHIVGMDIKRTTA
jgi:hypothetical protein